MHYRQSLKRFEELDRELEAHPLLAALQNKS
jgi:hypothetical protein